jgi:hypothetical protein
VGSGSGRFTVDTGTTPTTSTTFSKIGVAHVRVKVTDDAGKSVIASAAIDVVRRGGVGVSVDNGKYATNDPKLKLYLVWPANTGKARISADGGFGPSDRTRTVSVAPIVGWKAPSGSGRVARTVYVRFPDSTTPLQTYTDDIVLDTTHPTVQSATLLGKRGDVLGSSSARRRPFRESRTCRSRGCGTAAPRSCSSTPSAGAS